MSSPPQAPAATSSTAAGRAVRNAAEWIIIIVAALVVAFVVKTFLIQAFFIPSASMDPELKVGDRLLVNKLSYHLHDIHRGDIAVFDRPKCDLSDPAIKDLIKRVVGLGGETVEGREGGVFVNGRHLDERYLPKGVMTGDFAPVQVPPGHVWMMGDNRGNSKDSRFLCNNGPTFIAEHDIVGRAFVRVWPANAFSVL